MGKDEGPIDAAHGWGGYRQPPSQQGFTPAPQGPWVEESSQVFLASHLTLTISTIPLRSQLQVRLLTEFTQLGSGEAEKLTCVWLFSCINHNSYGTVPLGAGMEELTAASRLDNEQAALGICETGVSSSLPSPNRPKLVPPLPST